MQDILVQSCYLCMKIADDVLNKTFKIMYFQLFRFSEFIFWFST